MTGQEIKRYILAAGLCCWQVAERLGVNDGNFSRRLRKPFNAAEVEQIKRIVCELSGTTSYQLKNNSTHCSERML